MINFRFHLVSLVAVFLALAAGIVIGSTVVDRAIVEGLRDRIDDVESRSDDVRAKNSALADEAERANEELVASAPFSVEDRLLDEPVVVLAMRGVESDVVDAQVQRLVEAGADVPVVGWLERAWSLEETDDVEALHDAVGGPKGADLLRRVAFGSIAERLGRGVADRVGVSPTARDPEAPDILDALSEAGFVTLEQTSERTTDDIARWPIVEPYVLLVTTTDLAADVPGIEVQLARSFAARGADVAVSEVATDDSERAARVSAIRDSILADQISTVDNGESSTGQAAVVIALSESGLGPASHYGYGDGAQRPFPEWVQQ